MQPLPPDEAAALMARVAEAQDRAAFALLYRHFAPRVRGWLLKRGARGEHVEEIVHEVMLVVWRRAVRYDPRRASVSTWVFTIARNRHVDRVRKLSRPEPEPDDPDLVPKPAARADEQVALRRRAQLLRDAIAALPPEQARVIERAWLGGATLRAVAEDEGLPLGTVKSRARLAMKALRSRLQSLESAS